MRTDTRSALAKPTGADTPTAPPSNDGHPAAERLRELLSRRIATLRRSRRLLERELGWGHGILGNLLRGRTEITLRHVEALAPVLGTNPLELLSEAYAPISQPEGAQAEELEPGWLDVLAYQATALEEAGEVFQQLQAMVPLPTPEEVAEMRSGKRPIGRFAYLIAQLQSYMCTLENVASDLKVDLEYEFDPEGAEKLDNFYNALSTAVERLTPSSAARIDR